VSTIFTTEDAWHGSFYELLVELGPRADDRIVDSAARVFTHPALDGPYPARGPEPTQQQRVSPAAIVADGGGSLFGVGTLPTGDGVAVGVWTFRASSDSDNSRDPAGTDWLGVYVPLGSLSDVWPEVGPYPFLESDDEALAHQAWQERIEAWLVDIAQHLYAGVEFRLGVVGHEIESTGDDCRRWWSCSPDRLPPERWDGILLPESLNKLVWHPPTRRGGYVLEKTPGNPSSWAEIFGGGAGHSSS
jgi:hypothetical protein